MSKGLKIKPGGALDLLSLGALVHRLDPGIVPFRKATECLIHVSGGEYNVAANLSDCFGLKTGIATAMVDYPIGDLIAEGVRPFYRRFTHNGATGPNMVPCTATAAMASGRQSSSITARTRRRPSSSPEISTGARSSHPA